MKTVVTLAAAAEPPCSASWRPASVDQQTLELGLHGPAEQYMLGDGTDC